MKVIQTSIPDVLILEPKRYGDERGFFMESYNYRVFNEIIGYKMQFVQDNHSRSHKNVLRGLHYQICQSQGKLVRVVKGSVYDVAVDLRQSSPYFGKWVGLELSEKNNRQFWVPSGFGHAFLVLSDIADFLYKTTDYHAPEYERCIKWNDPDIGIDWPITEEPVLSEKDKRGQAFKNAEVFK